MMKPIFPVIFCSSLVFAVPAPALEGFDAAFVRTFLELSKLGKKMQRPDLQRGNDAMAKAIQAAQAAITAKKATEEAKVKAGGQATIIQAVVNVPPVVVPIPYLSETRAKAAVKKESQIDLTGKAQKFTDWFMGGSPGADLFPKLTPSPTPAPTMDLIHLQQSTEKWNISTQIQSNTIKRIGDSIAATVSDLR